MAYPPSYYVDDDWSRQRNIIDRFPLANLVLSTADYPKLVQVPMILDANDDTLLGHLAKANPIVPHLQNAKVVALFNGPDSYVSPNLYDGEPNVPTWNMISVKIKGELELVKNRDESIKVLQALNHHFERNQPIPWSLPDDHRYTLQLIDHIQAFRLRIKETLGTFKLSQNKTGEEYERIMQMMREEHPNHTDLFPPKAEQ